MHCNMDTRLLSELKKLKHAEEFKGKKKPKFALKKEKRLQYYSGWHEDDKPVNEDEL